MKFTAPAICYCCGQEFPPEQLTTEHIPPKGLFPKPRPSNLITVPSCTECNNGHSEDDELLRLITSAAINRSEAGGVVWEQKVVPNTFGRTRLKKDVGFMLENERKIMLNINGIDVPAVPTGVSAERVHALIERITKGLLRHHYPEVDVAELAFHVAPVRQDRVVAFAHDVFPFMKHELSGDKVFRYYHNLCQDAPKCGMWYLIFYDAIGFVVKHRDSEYPLESGS